MKRIIAFLIFFIILFDLLSSSSIPQWVKKRPVSKDYYIGIGVSAKSKDNKDYLQIAKDNALKNLASEIKVSISSEVLSQITEIDGKLKEYVKSAVKTSTQANIEGYEIVDTYEDKKNYWLYCRLSKTKYEENKRRRINKAKELSLSFFDKALKEEHKGNITEASYYYFQALKAIKDFPNEKSDFNGKNSFIINEIIKHIKSMYGKITLTALQNKISLKTNSSVKKYPEVSATYNKLPIPNLPIKIKFLKGEGDLLENETTNSNGIAAIHLTKIRSADKMQIIKAEIDMKKILDTDTTFVLAKEIVSSLPKASCKIFITVSGSVFYITSNEANFGQKTDVLYLAPKIKEALTNYNITFTNDISKADAMIKIKANTRKGSEIYGMYSAFADVTLSITDLKSGKELYKNTFSHIKGIDRNFNKAGLKALSNASEEILKKIKPVIKNNY